MGCGTSTANVGTGEGSNSIPHQNSNVVVENRKSQVSPKLFFANVPGSLYTVEDTTAVAMFNVQWPFCRNK
jgi:hypothetical protein